VATSLMHWGVFGAVPDDGTEYSTLEQSIERRIQGVKGFTESDNYHGEGTDWYEVVLAPDVATELRDGLARSGTVKPSAEFPQRTTAPPWWPIHWPADARCYEEELEFLVIPDSGTRAWFMRVRT